MVEAGLEDVLSCDCVNPFNPIHGMCDEHPPCFQHIWPWMRVSMSPAGHVRQVEAKKRNKQSRPVLCRHPQLKMCRDRDAALHCRDVRAAVDMLGANRQIVSLQSQAYDLAAGLQGPDRCS
jgi:hypothetical protein